jgi:hypothetical protein
MGNAIAALALLVSVFGAVWVVCQDLGRFRRLERYGNSVLAARENSLEENALRAMFDRLALPLALEALAPPRRGLRRSAWVLLAGGALAEAVWVRFIAADDHGPASWWSYGIGLALFVAGGITRNAWRDKRATWMRKEMDRRRRVALRAPE